MKEFHRGDFANRTGLAQAWTVKSADRLFTVFAWWQRTLCQWDQEVLPALEPGLLMTRACSLAAMGSKYPAHQREPHPGHQNALRLFMMTLQPASLVHYVQHLLIPACPSPTGETAWPFGLDVEVEVHAIGHSAGSYGAMVLAAVLEERAFAKTSEVPKSQQLRCLNHC